MAEKRARILVADDDKSLCKLLCLMLEHFGYSTHCVGSSSAALRVLAEHEIDMVLADRYMPGNEDLQLLRIIAEKYPGVPVVMMSGLREFDTVVDALHAGARDFLIKPIDIDRFSERIQRIFLSDRDDEAQRAADTFSMLWKQLDTSARFVAPSPLCVLSDLERKVVELFSQLGELHEVAHSLGVPATKVRHHVRAICWKLETSAEISPHQSVS